ncbi:MAG: terminase family protein [Sphingomicrobium sp.]
MIDLRRLMRALELSGAAARAKVLGGLSAADQRALDEAWAWQARRAQEPPPGDWRVWLILAGRGFGKTRTGAEWVLGKARATPDARIALVGATIDDVGRVMVEGESGIQACALTGETIKWQSSTGELRFPSGAIGQAFSGANPRGLRGPQHHFAWADELAKWAEPENTWNVLQMGLRLGDNPQLVVTTTPERLALLDRLVADRKVELSRGATFDNPHLPAAFVRAMIIDYGRSRLARQELHGELLGEVEGRCGRARRSRRAARRCRTARC